MDDKEAKEKMMEEMTVDLIDFYGIGSHPNEFLYLLADHLIRKGWRKVK
jgi:hypothetical protein